MKITKIIAGMSAAVIGAAMMSVSAFAATTITLEDPQTGEWQNCFQPYIDADGLSGDDYIDSRSLTKGTALDITINFEWTDAGKDANYCAVAPCQASDWAKILEAVPDGITCDYAKKEDLTEDKDNKAWKDADGNVVKAAIQSDGFIQALDSSVTSLSFTVSAEAVDSIIDTSDTTGGWDGILFMVGNNGMKITSIDFSQDVKMASAMDNGADTTSSSVESSSSKTDSKSQADSKADSSKAETSTAATNSTAKTTKTDSSSKASDDTAATGAAVGLALAGVAAASAIVIISKKNK